jgi:hypothetical protein
MHTHTKSHTFGVVVTIIVIACAAFLLIKSKSVAPSASGETQAVDAAVEAFGKQMQQVSLLAPSDALKSGMESAYGAYVAPELLAAWEADPSTAPGRETSSPWPDHIAIVSTQFSDSQTAIVSGTVVELTSNEVEHGGIANQYPVTITLKNRDGVWIITDFKK